MTARSTTAPRPPTIGALIRRVTRTPLGREILRFGTIGVLSTAAYIALYALLRGWAAPAPANAIALVVTAIGNTAANRRITFGVRGGDGAVRHQAAGLLAFAIALAITTASVMALHAAAPHAARWTEVVVLVGANVVATANRCIVRRRAIVPPGRGALPA